VSSNLLIVDDFLPDPDGFRAGVLGQEWRNIKFGGEVYKRIQARDYDEHKWLIEKAIGRAIQQEYTITRLNYAGEMPNNAIHSDNDCGAYAAVLYLNLPGQEQGGTALWRHKATGLESFDEVEIRRAGKSPFKTLETLSKDWNNPDAWEQVALAPMKFNRAIFYPGKCFHSRWPLDAFGSKPYDGRLVWCSFFNCA
jgi:hypothetical protein